MNVTVFGTGYVGLVQGAVLADVGHHVVCVDIDAAKVEALRFGRIPIYEPGLDEMVALNVEEYTAYPPAGVSGKALPTSRTIGSGRAFVFAEGRSSSGGAGGRSFHSPAQVQGRDAAWYQGFLPQISQPAGAVSDQTYQSRYGFSRPAFDC